MEEARLKKLQELRKRNINPYPYKFEVTDFIGSVRRKFETDPPEGFKVRIRGKAKRVSKTEEGYMVRLSDEENVEILVFTREEGLKQNEEYTFEGLLSRVEGKLSLTQAVLSEGDTESIRALKERFDSEPKEEKVSLGGRVVALRTMGKAVFGHIQDLTGKIQIYLKKDLVGDERFSFFNEFIDLGDIVGVEGELFRTQTGELTVEVHNFQLLAKCLHPLPEKWHGLKDVEVRYRQRYLDLIANPDARRTFLLRSKLISELRKFFDDRGFIEVETPILQPIASGANAKPFMTYHNYLEMNLYLRIAPELYLKRLIVGGFPRVYELGRNFRNEGVDRTHNPEFTMVEFYAAYWDYNDLMKFTEELFAHLLERTVGTLKLIYEGKEIDFTPPLRKVRYFDLLKEKTGRDKEFFLHNLSGLRELAKELDITNYDKLTHAKLIDKVFEKVAEEDLIQPTFVIDFPKILSPLAKTHREDSELVERFELIVATYEVANAYTELNDPADQRERFVEQIKEKEMGDEEAMAMDEDFIRALEYGMPPTAGEGIGIDRLVMILTNTDTIRDVILFPHMRPQ
ncbi:lysyl-tRNA synthetase class II [Hydrogenivirga caldilitoris]|uniref:Lysine--tRNA ligase n=1 Tax=Hydrogenivirga caldilitoris TaxID=246264 RepID=A0A497XNH0_9AQUI|nr:lysine--tRNA ligase [Hydrogenivirga caldilitoris]RLJ69801.1 lysyl-tRNA synthetase class II [Hydrogenivirga caldilitoris]